MKIQQEEEEMLSYSLDNPPTQNAGIPLHTVATAAASYSEKKKLMELPVMHNSTFSGDTSLLPSRGRAKSECR